MHILGIVGSMRKDGNTNILVNHCLDAVKEQLPAAATEVVYIADKAIQPCRVACSKFCSTNPYQCTIKDGVTEVFEKMRAADAIVIGAPLYVRVPPAHFHAFVERLISSFFFYESNNSQITESPLNNKPCGLIAVAEYSNPHRVLEYLHDCCLSLKMKPMALKKFPCLGVAGQGDIAKDRTFQPYVLSGMLAHALAEELGMKQRDKPPVQEPTVEFHGGSKSNKWEGQMAKKSGGGPVMKIKISLSKGDLPIWRRVLVPAGMNLGDFHYLIQDVMGWENSHLHQFVVGKTMYSDPAFDEGSGDMEEAKDENRITLAEILKKPKDKFFYEYDFGDDWSHEILLEEAMPTSQEKQIPCCLEGKGACPPEDSGGVGGYQEKLDILKSPDQGNEDLENVKEWMGAFDPDHFDLKAVNRNIKKDFTRTLTKKAMEEDGVS